MKVQGADQIIQKFQILAAIKDIKDLEAPRARIEMATHQLCFIQAIGLVVIVDTLVSCRIT